MRHACALGTVGGGVLGLVLALPLLGDPPRLGARVDDRAGVRVVRADGAEVQTTGDEVRDLALVRLGESAGSALTWRQVGAGGEVRSFYAFTSAGGDGVWSRAIEGDNRTLELRWERFDPLAPGAKARPVPAQLAADGDHRAYIVQFVVPPTERMRGQVEKAGGVVYAFLPMSALVVDLDAKGVEAVRALPGVRWVGAFEPAYRCVPEILRGYMPKFGGNDAPSRDEFAANWAPQYVEAMERFAKGEPASFWVQVQRRLVSGAAVPILPAKQAVAHAVGQLGGKVEQFTPDDDVLRALLTQEQLVGLLHVTEVAFVDPWGPPGTDMDIARQVSGANTLESITGMTGQGVRGELMDGGLRITHQAFSDPGPAPIVRTNSTDTSHGTSTFGILFGDGTANAAGRGLLPSAEAKYIFAYGSLGSSRLSVTTDAVNQNHIVFQSNSWGSSLTTAYTTISQGMDQIIFQTGLLICQSQSNNNNQQSRPEAWAKNVLAVGGFNHLNTASRTDDTRGGASIGPAADGRIKPEISHFYDSVQTTSSTSDTSYTTSFGGTSAATPITCGYMGLIFQMWHEGYFPGYGRQASVFDSRPSFTTARALAIQSAYRYTWTAGGSNASITRNIQGWGTIDVANLLAMAPTMYVQNEAKNLGAGQSASYTFDVAPGAPAGALRATMVYADPPGTVSSTQHRINDVSLRVTAPDGTFWWGNNGLSASNWSTPGGSSNVKDTVENVFVQNPAPGRYRVEVFADVVAQDGNTRTPATDVAYALVVSGAQRTPVRVVTLDTTRAGACGGFDQGFTSGAAFAAERQWLADAALFGGAAPLGGIDRPVVLLPPVVELTAQSLAGADVVLLTGQAYGPSVCERSVLAQFVRQGGGVLASYDNAAHDLGLLFQAGAGGAASSPSYDPEPGAPITTGPYGAVAGAVPGGSSRVFASLGPTGAAVLRSGGQIVGAAFTLGQGRAVLVNDSEWAALGDGAGCGQGVAPGTSARAFFLNALASVVPGSPVAFTLACCPGDFNSSGAVSVQDLFDFLDDWFNDDSLADLDGGGVTTQDLFDFLASWFAGC